MTDSPSSPDWTSTGRTEKTENTQRKEMKVDLNVAMLLNWSCCHFISIICIECTDQ